MDKSEFVFFDVDTQNDFLDYRCNLYIPGCEHIKENLARLVAFAMENNIALVATMDTHTVNDPQFHYFQPHCLPDTKGWEKIPETNCCDYQIIEAIEIGGLKFRGNKFLVKKAEINPFSNHNLKKLIKWLGKRKFVVFGVTTEYCVKHVINGLLSMELPNENFLVQLVEDAIIGINDRDSEATLEEVKSRGVKLVRTEEVLRGLI